MALEFQNQTELYAWLAGHDLDTEEPISKEVDLRFEFEDKDIMWFGKHKTKPLGVIPLTYLTWLWEQGYNEKTGLNNNEGKLARYIQKAIQ